MNQQTDDCLKVLRCAAVLVPDQGRCQMIPRPHLIDAEPPYVALKITKVELRSFKSPFNWEIAG